MATRITATIKEQRELAPFIYEMTLAAPDVARNAKPGQFVNLFVGDGAHILPRPISLAGIDEEARELRLIYRISGEGTKAFSVLQAGDAIDLLGSLGNGFPLEEAKDKEVLLVGGGIGIPPLLATAQALLEMGTRSVTAVLGYRDAGTFLADEFASCTDAVQIATEDGSVGTRGTVMDILRNAAVSENTILFACGPTPMLRALQDFAKDTKICSWLSLEERMACGVGVCLACVCKTAEADAHSKVHNRRVCKDGPVFPAEEIVLPGPGGEHKG